MTGLPDNASTLDGLLRLRAERTPDRPAYLFLADGETEADHATWGELDRRARAVAAALRRACAPGDRALLLCPPGLDFIAAFFGCLYAGVVAVPAYPPRPRRDSPRLRAIAADASPAVVITAPDLLAGVRELAAREPALGGLPWLAPGREEESGGDGGGLWRRPGDGEPDAPAFLQYTSGSTSLPKGVVVSHANLLHNERMIQSAFGLGEEAVVVSWLPLYHDMGLIGTALQPLQCGGRAVLMSPVAFLQRPRRWLEAVSRYRGTASGGPNFAFELCVRKIPPGEREGLDLASWTVAFDGAEPVRAETLERFAAAFMPCGFDRRALFPCYGLAEATLFVTGGRPGQGARTARIEAAALARHEAVPAAAGAGLTLVSSGRPAADQRVLVVDPESCAELPEGRVGEIWVSGPSVARAYWGRPEASESELCARLADGGGSFLRTGDLGFLRGGELYVTGRRKDLIILRGRNHYPQDLELTAERAHRALRPGGGAAFSIEAGGEERLVLVFEVERHTSSAPPVEEVAASVRRGLAEEHEVQLHDLVLIRQASLPRTSSGKVQRHACRALYLSGGLAAQGRSALGDSPAAGPSPPGHGIEDFLHAALARAVRLDPTRIDRRQAMTSFGLDSLAAIELQHAIEAEFGAAPSVAALLEGISILEAAGEVAALAAAAPMALPRQASKHCSEYPLSFGQQALWALHGLEPASAAYNIAGAAKLLGGADPGRLARAFQALVDRHPALRTTYENGPDGPLQRVHGKVAAAFVHEDAADWSGEELRRRSADMAFRPFDLENGPVFRAALFDRGSVDPCGSVLVLAVHHIAADFWSLGVLVRELGELYAEGEHADLPAPAFHYADFVQRQRRERAAGRYDEMLSQAREQLAGVPPLDLPLSRPRPALQTWRGALLGERLRPELAEAVGALARRSGATLFMVLLAGFEALLARYTGQELFLVGTPTSGRSAGETSGLIGYLVNPVPLRADLSHDPDVRTLVARARRAALDGLARQDLPFSLLVESLAEERDPSRPAVVQAMLVLERAPAPELESLAAFALDEGGARLSLGGMTLESMALKPASAQFDLTLLAAEMNGDLAVAFQWNVDLLEATVARRMIGHFSRLLGAMTQGEDLRISDLAMLSPAEEQQIFCEWNATAVPSPEACLQDLVEAQVKRTPEAPAVVFERDRLTYWHLNALANRLAHHLQRLGVGPEVRVALCLERSAELVVGVLATLKAGGAFVPIDPAYPAERLAYMLEDSQASVVLTQERIAPLLPVDRARIVLADEHAGWRSGADPGNPPGSVHPDHLAYVVYTSGSTGRPKGAMNSHRAILNRLRWMQETFRFTAADRFLQKTPASFDVSVWELFSPLLAGSCLVVARPGGHLDPAYLRDEIARRGVTTVHFVPSLLQVFLAQPGLEACACLRRVIVSGEALPRELVVRFQARLGSLGVELHNLYGPAEAAVEVTWWPCPEAGEGPVPIGRPIDNTRIYLLGRHLQPVAIGIAGELHIGGVQVARGYLGRPELTVARFIPDPFAAQPGSRLYRTGDLVRYRSDGELEYLGRIDHQVKVLGVRIELGEIEHALASHAAVREAVVVAREKAGKTRLAAYVVPVGEAPTAAALREHLEGKLPETLIPSIWMFLPSLPLSPSGKVDRAALPAPETEPAAGAFAAPGTAAEEALASIWSEVLGRERVGVHDNFFALGGDSITGLQVISKAGQAGLRLTPRQIFRHPTIFALASMAERIEDGAAEPEQVVGGVPLTPIQRWFFEQRLPDPHHYNQAVMLLAGETLVPAHLQAAFSRILAHHDAVRLRFTPSAEGWRQESSGSDGLTEAPWHHIDLSGLPAPSQTAEIERGAARVQASFDLARGPLLRAAFFDTGEAGLPRLLVAAHHLVIDGVSWRILLGDLEDAYRKARNGEPVVLGPKTTSFRRWALALASQAAAGAFAPQAEYWLAAAAALTPLPRAAPQAAAATVATARTVEVALSAEETHQLLQELPACNTQVIEVLLTALLKAVSSWTGSHRLRIDLEGHGRESVEDLDLSRTLGWFTTLTPVVLELKRGDPGVALRAVKEQLQHIPHRGLGYGVLRYLGGDALAERLGALPDAEICFNYLGQLDTALPRGALFAPTFDLMGPTRSARQRLPYRLEINGSVLGGQLRTSWGYSTDLDLPATVERLSGDFLGELRSLIAHCRQTGDGAFMASDFPDADLSDRDLQKLMSKLFQSERGLDS